VIRTLPAAIVSAVRSIESVGLAAVGLKCDDLVSVKEIAARMTYVELSADNSFYEAFTSALFLPHTDLSKFPSVAETLEEKGT